MRRVPLQMTDRETCEGPADDVGAVVGLVNLGLTVPVAAEDTRRERPSVSAARKGLKTGRSLGSDGTRVGR